MRFSLPWVMGPLGLLSLASCVSTRQPPTHPTCPEQPALVTASALIELLPEKGASSAPSFDDREVLRSASAAVRSEVRPGDVRVHREGAIMDVRVDGKGEQGALARCEAVVRAGMASTLPDDAWLIEKRDRAMDRLAMLDRSIESAPVLAEPANPEAYIEWAKETAAALDASTALPAGLDGRPELRAVEAMQRDMVEVRGLLNQLQASGLLSRHPEVMEAERRRKAIEDRLMGQRRAEADALRLLTEAWSRAGKGTPHERWRSAMLQARLWYLEKATLGAVAFLAPVELRLLGLEHGMLRARDEALAVRMGDRHPERIVVLAKLESIGEAFERGRAAALVIAREQLNTRGKTMPAPGEDERERAMRAERDEVVSLLLELHRRAAVASEPGSRVRRACAVIH